MGDDRKSAGWGQLNGKPIYKNLNADSTHPRPWRPPTDFDVLKRFYDPYPIFTHMGPQYFKRSHNWVEDDPFMSNLYWASKKGFGIGIVLAFFDHTLYSRLQGAKQQFLRASYITLPVMSMFVSYISLREFSANMLERFTTKKRDSAWTYSIAALGPTAVVLGAARMTIPAGFFVWWTSAFAGLAHKEYKQMGRDIFAGMGDGESLSEDSNKQWWYGPLDYKRANTRWSYYTNRDPGPTFDKFEEK